MNLSFKMGSLHSRPIASLKIWVSPTSQQPETVDEGRGRECIKLLLRVLRMDVFFMILEEAIFCKWID